MLDAGKAYSGFAVYDLQQAKQFYSETLGLEIAGGRRLGDEAADVVVLVRRDRAALIDRALQAVQPRRDLFEAAFMELDLVLRARAVAFPYDDLHAVPLRRSSYQSQSCCRLAPVPRAPQPDGHSNR